MPRSDYDSPALAIPAELKSNSSADGREGPASRVIQLPDRPARSMATLRTFIATVSGIAGARAASLLIDPAPLPGVDPLLLSTGDARPISGFESAKAALALTAELTELGNPVPVPSAKGAVRYYRGPAGGTHFFRISLAEAAAMATRPGHRGFPVERRRAGAAKAVGRPEGSAWIGLGFDDGEACRLGGGLRTEPEASSGEGLLAAPDWFFELLVSGARIAWQLYELSATHRDSITGLTRRSELQVQLEHALAAASEGHGSFTLALINPDEFAQINQRLGRARGDAVLREVGAFLQEKVRQPDGLFHYGGAVFAAQLWAASEAEASRAAERLRNDLRRHPLLDGEIRLEFSVGAVFHGKQTRGDTQVDVAELLRRADSALNVAKEAGGARTMVWASQGFTGTSGGSDRLSGIFTADTRKDYRNMLLLWDTIQVISSHTDTAAIANEFVDRVNRTFKPSHTALVSVGSNGLSGLPSATPSTAGPTFAKASDDVALLLSSDQRRLLARAHQRQQTQSARILAPGGGGTARQPLTAYAVPLPGDEKSTRCLYVDGPADSFRLDSADLVFLSLLSRQVAVTLDRSELMSRLKQEEERESRRLRAEVRDLRQALRHSKLVFQSPRMEALLEVVRRVAPTDATVLITGESGTGKEMIARFLHDQSQRRIKDAFVTVDCGAIAPSLIETELFGHAKGAYTGASGSSKGRIVQAEGGTLFLDEIGELPLDVQARLLRFVQEREITPVGGSRCRKVDARIVAATNRDLAAEVAAGRFRQDLYYRLRVVTVTVPPLRDRPEDIMPLAHYFLETFSAQYEKPERCLSAEAQTALREHSWAGNVRELQNQLLQAVIMSANQELSRSDLRLETESEMEKRVRASADTAPFGGQAAASALLGEGATGANAQSGCDEPEQGYGGDCPPWEALRQALARQVEEAIRQDPSAALPLGTWLSEDLVILAHEAYGGVARKASEALGMPETTFRRQLQKISRAAGVFKLPRSPRWASVKPVIRELVRSAGPRQGENLVLSARRLLMAEVIPRIPANDALGSVLMGVTKPTYQRWKAEQEHQGRA